MILTGRKTLGRGTSVTTIFDGDQAILWLTARAALGAGSGGGDVGVREVAATYHVPISNTAAGMMLLEPAG
jgi:hypothetical protein